MFSIEKERGPAKVKKFPLCGDLSLETKKVKIKKSWKMSQIWFVSRNLDVKKV